MPGRHLAPAGILVEGLGGDHGAAEARIVLVIIERRRLGVYRRAHRVHRGAVAGRHAQQGPGFGIRQPFGHPFDRRGQRLAGTARVLPDQGEKMLGIRVAVDSGFDAFVERSAQTPPQTVREIGDETVVGEDQAIVRERLRVQGVGAVAGGGAAHVAQPQAVVQAAAQRFQIRVRPDRQDGAVDRRPPVRREPGGAPTVGVDHRRAHLARRPGLAIKTVRRLPQEAVERQRRSEIGGNTAHTTGPRLLSTAWTC